MNKTFSGMKLAKNPRMSTNVGKSLSTLSSWFRTPQTPPFREELLAFYFSINPHQYLFLLLITSSKEELIPKKIYRIKLKVFPEPKCSHLLVRMNSLEDHMWQRSQRSTRRRSNRPD